VANGLSNNMLTQTNDFKLLAIRPLDGCNRDYCNNLEYGQLYQFYSGYSFTENESKKVIAIIRDEDDFDLHSEYIKDKETLRINVAAIVGKNGSGKSTLAELLYMCCYLVAHSNDLVPISLKSPAGKRQINDLEKIRSGLKLELFFQIGQSYTCYYINGEASVLSNLNNSLKYYNLISGVPIPLTTFFYTIAINYSIYSLNELILGPWVGRLFHKNDGYQTPIVLNPFRDDGNINVNAEMHFAQTRLLSNLQYDKTNGGEILPGRQVKEIAFTFDKAKLLRFDGHSIQRVFDELESATGKTYVEVFRMIYIAFLEEDPDDARIQNEEWAELARNYVVSKSIRITKNYPEYQRYFKTYSEEQVPGIQSLDALINDLKDDLSHITLKLRQALNFFRNDPLRADDDRIKVSQRRVTIPAELFAQRRAEYARQFPKRDPMEFVPIAPFTPRIILKGGRVFSKLSSGEQQYVHSIQAILYHILNVNSVFNTNEQHLKATYKFINIVLDEIELYFHPEFQRRFLNDLLHILSGMNLGNIKGINILLLTHSPFILSDIPAPNVIKLDDGKLREQKTLTFAGNIHQMLMNSFFMSSTTGDFARYQYEAIIKFHREVKNSAKEKRPELLQRYLDLREKFRFIVSQVAEDVIRGILENHLDFLEKELVATVEDADFRKRELQAQLALITKKLEDLE
jgi:hypothetical protein